MNLETTGIALSKGNRPRMNPQQNVRLLNFGEKEPSIILTSFAAVQQPVFGQKMQLWREEEQMRQSNRGEPNREL